MSTEQQTVRLRFRGIINLVAMVSIIASLFTGPHFIYVFLFALVAIGNAILATTKYTITDEVKFPRGSAILYKITVVVYLWLAFVIYNNLNVEPINKDTLKEQGVSNEGPRS